MSYSIFPTGGLMDAYSHSQSISTISSIIMNNQYDRPIKTVEKDNCKILQYELIGLNKNNITVKKEFVNKTKILTVIVEGKYKDEVTDFENDINIKLDVDYKVYDQVTWKIQDGILTIVLHEIINDVPHVSLYEEYL